MTEAQDTTAPTSAPAATPQLNSKPKAIPISEEGEKNNLVKSESELDNLYDALQKVGVYNITTLAKRLGFADDEELQDNEVDFTENKEPKIASHSKIDSESPKKNTDFEAPKKTADNQVRNNAKILLRLMGLDDNDDCVSMLENICIQGKEMLGEMSSTTITSAPTSRFTEQKHKSENPKFT
jgi:hypothetical protein